MYLNHRATVVGAVLLLGLFISTVRADVQYPSGTQTFETMAVGDDVGVVGAWFTVNDSAPPELFTVLAANDVLGSPTTRGSSTRWLRVKDLDARNVQNRFYSTNVTSPAIENYQWTFFVNLETLPPGGADTKPKLTIQHMNAAALPVPAFANAWGIDFTSTGANLIVLGIGGTAASTPLYSYAFPTGIGSWVKLTLTVNFADNTVTASVNNGASATLPINLIASGDKKLFRFCYRGEGLGNANTMLVDDVSVAVGSAIPPPKASVPAASGWGLVLMTALALAALALRFGRSRSAARLPQVV